jgi:hypothetical protein
LQVRLESQAVDFKELLVGEGNVGSRVVKTAAAQNVVHQAADVEHSPRAVRPNAVEAVVAELAQ